MDDGSRALVLRTEPDGRQLLRMLFRNAAPPCGRNTGTEWLHVLRGRLGEVGLGPLAASSNGP